jgi:hypothetical protein
MPLPHLCHQNFLWLGLDGYTAVCAFAFWLSYRISFSPQALPASTHPSRTMFDFAAAARSLQNVQSFIRHLFQ